MQTYKFKFKLSLALILTVLLSGCQSIQYYAQAVGGHVNVLRQQRPITEVLRDEAVTAKTREQLKQILVFRRFASDALSLPDNKSYTRYADLERNFAVWNVVATPKYSVEPVKSCFPIVGCLSYRGYYAKQDAVARAKQLKNDGLDVHVGGVSAYSTLGWFADPVLNTMLARSNAAMAGLLFHELAHQQLYVKGDTKFNESFATAVETLGLQQWAKAQAQTDAIDHYFAVKLKRAEVVKLVLVARERMHKAYLGQSDEKRLAEIKQAQFKLLRDDYTQLRENGGGTPGFDRFFAAELNHATLALFGEYHGWVSAFERLFAQNKQNWKAFYRAAEMLGDKPLDTREAILQDLSG